MIVWMIWGQEGDSATWLITAWDDDQTANTPSAWKTEVDRWRKHGLENGYEVRVQRVEVPGVYDLFAVPSVVASSRDQGPTS